MSVPHWRNCMTLQVKVFFFNFDEKSPEINSFTCFIITCPVYISVVRGPWSRLWSIRHFLNVKITVEANLWHVKASL